MKKPKYPVYVISKGRHDCCYTADFLIADKVPFKIVIEPQERILYEEKYSKHILLDLPFSNLGLGSIPARNWVWEHSIKNKHKRHWLLDDNIKEIYRSYKGKRIRSVSLPAFFTVEEFTDRYENIAIAGLNYTMFCLPHLRAFSLNQHVYSFMLINNKVTNRWRGRYNEDTDLCLQVLANNWCTVLINVFSCNKVRTMTMKGGNSTELYKGDGRLDMANSLKRLWPKVVDVKRRFKRPQHVIKDQWGKFDTPLIKKKNIHISKQPNEFGLKIIQKDKIKSQRLKNITKGFNG
tara:strand:- start:2426 stop:3301 length:876 start_codon:yes stop_codon:yes gene_type:complete